MVKFTATVTVSSKGQITLPKPIRSAMGVDAGTKLGFTMVGDEMRVVKIEGADRHHDPVLNIFLDLLANDIAAGKVIAELPSDVIAYARTRDLSRVDIDEAIEGAVEL